MPSLASAWHSAFKIAPIYCSNFAPPLKFIFSFATRKNISFTPQKPEYPTRAKFHITALNKRTFATRKNVHSDLNYMKT